MQQRRTDEVRGVARTELAHRLGAMALEGARTDLHAFFDHLVPEDTPYFVHTYEGPDDMPAHIKAALTQTSLSIPISNGRLVLGTWQGIYLFEHRTALHTRRVVAHISA